MSGFAFTALRSVTTDARGEFATRLPTGPSREIRLSAARPGGWAVATLRTIVKAPISIKTNRVGPATGGPCGSPAPIPGAPADARTRIDLQAWAGGHWLTFADPTLKRGRFGAKYTFTRTFTPTTYRFRAVLRRRPTSRTPPAVPRGPRTRGP